MSKTRLTTASEGERRRVPRGPSTPRAASADAAGSGPCGPTRKPERTRPTGGREETSLRSRSQSRSADVASYCVMGEMTYDFIFAFRLVSVWLKQNRFSPLITWFETSLIRQQLNAEILMNKISDLMLWAQSHDDPRIIHLGQSAETRLEGLEDIESLLSEECIANDMELQRLSVKVNLLAIPSLMETEYCGSDE